MVWAAIYRKPFQCTDILEKNNLIGNNLQLLPKERENTNTLLMELHGNLYLPAGF